MSCCGTDTRGCYTNDSSTEPKCTSYSSNKLDVHDWLSGLESTKKTDDIIEIRFKNTLKEYYLNVNKLKLKKGDVVAVEASPGHDIGTVSLVGELVFEQLRKKNKDWYKAEFKKIYRKAKPSDIEKWNEAIVLENSTMFKARQLAKKLNLDMKIGDVEYQGDKTKAIFYYLAEERVDFRELIKVLAEEFNVRIEMRQIGARQEAGKIGGIGSCGMELCCSKWMSNFSSVSTNSARAQELSLNPQKLAGQCGKLKCCLNFEVDSYRDAKKDFPKTDTPLDTESGRAFYQKTDIYKRVMWYTQKIDGIIKFTEIPVDRVKEIIKLNKEGVKVEALVEKFEAPKKSEFVDAVGFDNIDRFNKKKSKPKKKKRKWKPREKK